MAVQKFKPWCGKCSSYHSVTVAGCPPPPVGPLPPRCCNCNLHHQPGACTSDRRVPRFEDQPGNISPEWRPEELAQARETRAGVKAAMEKEVSERGPLNPSGFGLTTGDSAPATDKGAARKMDSGKPPLGQGVLAYFARALYAIAYVSEYGDRKYAQPGKPSYSKAWQDVENGEARYGDADTRHRIKVKWEGDYDAESELAHLAHKAWNALAELEIALKSGRVQCRVGVVVINGVPQPGTSKVVELG